ncbi:MAG: hypothetical protein ACYCYP_02540 [Leptospirales bacterium]
MKWPGPGAPARDEAPFSSMPVWDGNLFSEPFPFRIFLFRQDMTSLNGLLGWLDMWHSGLLTRTLAPFFRKEKTFPESFLLVPAMQPLHHGFLMLPVDAFPKGQLAESIVRIVRQLGVGTAVIDVSTVSNDTALELEAIADNPIMSGETVRIFVSDPSDFPASCLSRASEGMKGLRHTSHHSR